jgi:hypothetical protein
MRNRTSLLLGCLIAVSGTLCLPACLKDKVKESFGQDSLTVSTKIYTPIYTLKSTVLASINGSPAQPIVKPGQLYIKGSYIYLNDVNEGIHVIDNSDPANPVQKAFLNIPGNQNIAIRGNTLYADMYSDLLAIDISNPTQATIEDTLSNVFTNRGSYNYGAGSNNVITSWTIRDTSFQVKAYGDPLGEVLHSIPGTNFYTFDVAAAPAAASYIASTNTNTTGTAGSTATMTLIGDYLYAVPESHTLGVIDVTDPTHPALVTTIFAGLDLETIFPMEDKLLLGSMEGVYIYSLANPAKPVQIGEFKHGTACDPVIADSSYAYVTLHSGSYCGGASNELDIVSAQDLTNTSLLKSYPMTGPSGLSKDGSILFVCDGQAIKVFNAADPLNLQQLTELKVSNAYDVIAANHLLLVVSTGGLYEYDYSDPSHINQLSHLAVN